MSNEIQFEGCLRKRSRHAHLWRERWVVLTRSQLLTFRDERRYVEPTEVIDVKDLAAIVLSTAQRWPTLTLSTAKCAFVFCTSARSTTETPSLHSWSRQLRALRCIGGERSLIASLPDDVLSCVFELLPSSSSTAGTCRKWRDVQLELSARQHTEAKARIEHLWSTDAQYHLATLRRHRTAAGAHAYFTLHVEHTDELLMRADVDVRRQCFVIRCPLKAPSRGGGVACLDRVVHAQQPMQHVGTLVGRPTYTDVLLSRWTLYDHGRPPTGARARTEHASEAAASSVLERSELAYVSITHSMWAARCISVALPAPICVSEAEAETIVVVDNSTHLDAPGAPAFVRAAQSLPPTPPRPPVRQRSLATRARLQQWWGGGGESSIAVLHNAPPAWSTELRAFTLPFFGRVHLASKKNFQMIDRKRPDVVVMIFGKSQKDTYALDWCRPLSCLQALGIALSSFDSCLAVSATNRSGRLRARSNN